METELRYRHILAAALSAIWAIAPAKLDEIMAFLSFVGSGGHYSAEELQQRYGAAQRPQARTAGQIAVLPLMGTIVPRGNLLADTSGTVSMERWMQGFRQAMQDPAIGAVVLDVDSPGGTVNGVPEAADEIRRYRGTKPILAVANQTAASAAFWLAVQADELYVAPSGEVGSIGVFALHQDESVAQEKLGVKTTLISAAVGPRKTEGNPFEPLNDEARAYIQQRVDDYGSMFVNDVARGRGTTAEDVRENYGQGRMLGAKAAKAAKMVDGIATLDEVIGLASRRARQQQGARAELDLRQRRLRAAVR